MIHPAFHLRHSSDRVFLDSDELQDLDSLFECVRSQVAFLVPLLTPGLMMRPWCVGELATAYLNKAFEKKRLTTWMQRDSS